MIEIEHDLVRHELKDDQNVTGFAASIAGCDCVARDLIHFPTIAISVCQFFFTELNEIAVELERCKMRCLVNFRPL
jgi:hypothetical protein